MVLFIFISIIFTHYYLHATCSSVPSNSLHPIFNAFFYCLFVVINLCIQLVLSNWLIGHQLGLDHTTSNHSFKVEWLSLTLQLSTRNSVRVGVWQIPPASILDYWLTWSPVYNNRCCELMLEMTMSCQEVIKNDIILLATFTQETINMNFKRTKKPWLVGASEGRKVY